MVAGNKACPEFLSTLETFGLSSFSTKHFADRYQEHYPSIWKAILKLYGPGGEGSKRYFSSYSHVAHVLNGLVHDQKLTKLDYRDAPSGWGSSKIRYWTLDRSSLGGTIFPEEVGEEFVEGAPCKVTVNRYERDQKARVKCIERYGLSCSGCGTDFEKIYGPHGAGFIHVHHLQPIHKIGKAYKVDPVKDLRPVCPNCHAMIHYKDPMLDIAQLRKLLGKDVA